MKKKRHPLKRMRITLAVVFCSAVTLLYFDPTGRSAILLSGWFLPTQLVPALLKLMGGSVIVLAGLIPILLLTLFFGRVYCSAICPLGVYQDFIIRIRRRVRGKRWFKYGAPPAWFHYSVLGIIVLTAFGGSFFLLNLFEPFSNYGRFFSSAVAPAVIAFNNAAAFLLNRLGLPVLYQLPWRVAAVTALLAPVFFMAGVGALAFWRGRFFCNALCPAGALLGLLSRLSLYRIRVDHHRCNDCGLCERVCKAECIKSDAKQVDFAACVGCFNCIDACPTVGMSFEPVWRRPKEIAAVDVGRRSALSALIVPLVSAGSTTRVAAPSAGPTYDESRSLPVTPPGALSRNRFADRCTACHLCISACPTQVLYPSVLEYGLDGLFLPRMNYQASYCNFDCVICGNVCPTGALLPLAVDEKKLTQLGKARFVRDDCIVVTKKTDCGACSEHCPTKAVRMVPEGKLMLPEMREQLCIGCGACEHACPTKPRKAIYVIASAVHGRAEKPDTKPVQEGKQDLEEFPF